MANAQRKPRIAQVMKELPFHLGHHVAGGTVAEGGIKAEGGFAEPLVGGAKHTVVGEAMAEGKAAGLLMGQAEMGEGKGLLLRRQPPRIGTLMGSRLWSLEKGAAGRCRASATMAHPLAAIRERWKGFSLPLGSGQAGREAAGRALAVCFLRERQGGALASWAMAMRHVP